MLSRSAAILVLALALAPALALAQGTLERPIVCSGTDGRTHACQYPEVLIVQGRVVDAFGQPVVNQEVDITIAEPGVTGKPTPALTNCFGDYITWFELAHLDPTGTVTVTYHGTGGAPDATATQPLEPFWRRNDVNLTYQGQAPNDSCPDQTPLWPSRVTVTGRILERTADRTVNGETVQGTPYLGYVHLRFWEDGTVLHCPPAGDQQPGKCEPQPVNVSRGDFRYSWVNRGPLHANGTIEVLWGRNSSQSANFTVDPTFRYALAYIESTGKGAPTFVHAKPSPGLGAPATVAIASIVALAGARLLGKRRPPQAP